MITKTEVENVISPLLHPLFSKAGFEKVPHQILQFRKYIDNGFQSCIFYITEHDGLCWIEFSLGIRIDFVERLANQFTLTLEDYYNDSHTILTSYGRMVGQQYFRFKVSNTEELKIVCKQLEDFLTDSGFNFLNKHSSIFHLDKLLNDYPEKPSPYIYNQSNRCIKGIIIAKMAHNPYFPTLIKAYEFILGKQNLSKQIMPKYLKLIDYLKLISMN